MQYKPKALLQFRFLLAFIQWFLLGMGVASILLGELNWIEPIIYLLTTLVGLYLLLDGENKLAVWMLYLLTVWVVYYSVHHDHRLAEPKKLLYGKRLVLMLLVASGFLSSLPASAQIHQAGQTTLEISGGLVDGFKVPGQDNFGTFGSLSYGKYRTLNSYWKGTVHLNQKFYAYDKTRVPVSQWLGEATYFTRVMGLVNKSWMLNVGGGIAGGYESINQDRGEIQGASIMNQSQWVLGPTLAIEGEYILTGRTILIARAQEYYLFRSTIIPTHFNVGIGLKFILDSDSNNQ